MRFNVYNTRATYVARLKRSYPLPFTLFMC